MKKNIKKIALFFLIIVTLIVGMVFILRNNSQLKIENYPIIHETKFGGVYIKITIDEFNKLGFKYGDSVNVKFSNGYELLDLPYYNGYYVDIGEPLLIAYPGYDYIKVGINYGDDVWIIANLNEDDKATISLNETAKYLKNQNARDIHYTDIQGNIPDIVFANFRNVSVGNIKENALYRSASPSDNSHNRAPVVDRLIKEEKINYIVNLSDGESDLIEHINKDNFNSPYFLTLYNDKKVIPLAMNMQFRESLILKSAKEQEEEPSFNIILQMKELTFGEKLAKGLTAMSENDGPYLIHCVEGKDRTGYVLMVIESLMGATYEEIIDDYMLTYKNYYDITKEGDIDRYETIKEKNIDAMLHYIIGDEKGEKDLSKIDNYSNYARRYLLAIGMKEESVNKLVDVLSK